MKELDLLGNENGNKLIRAFIMLGGSSQNVKLNKDAQTLEVTENGEIVLCNLIILTKPQQLYIAKFEKHVLMSRTIEMKNELKAHFLDNNIIVF